MEAETHAETSLVLASDMVVALPEVKRRIGELQAFVKEYMVQGEDYGTIPGTKKPSLYKPGAEKLCDVYGFTPEFTIAATIEDWDAGRFHYLIKCTLRSKRTGAVQAEGLGECNSMESKYRWNWLFPSQIPEGVDKGTLVKRPLKNGKGYQYRVPNDDPFSVVNTVLKMAKKRALVDTVLSATRSSGIFSQDLEDLASNGVIDAEFAEAAPDPSPPQNKGGTPETHDAPPKAQQEKPTTGKGHTDAPPLHPNQQLLQVLPRVQGRFDSDMLRRTTMVVTRDVKLSECAPEVIRSLARLYEALGDAWDAGWRDADCEKTFHGVATAGERWSLYTTDLAIAALQHLAAVPFADTNSAPVAPDHPLDVPLPDPLTF